MGAIFGMATCLSAQARDAPDDPTNYFIGGCASGIFLGARSEYINQTQQYLHDSSFVQNDSVFFVNINEVLCFVFMFSTQCYHGYDSMFGAGNCGYAHQGWKNGRLESIRTPKAVISNMSHVFDVFILYIA